MNLANATLSSIVYMDAPIKLYMCSWVALLAAAGSGIERRKMSHTVMLVTNILIHMMQSARP